MLSLVFICTVLSFGVIAVTADDVVRMQLAPDVIDNVHVVFMNHLDVGYNGINPELGFIDNILNKYFHIYFPRAVSLAEELRKGGHKETFIYTTHPWLVDLYVNCPVDFALNGIKLKCPNSSDIAAFNAAVGRGDITWHAGPMNMQFENMNEILLEMSLNISSNLDKRYNITRKFRTLSQRDVPGMTKSVIPVFIKKGISAVSVGVNPGTSPPAVPKIFRWKMNDDEIIAMWNKGGYPLNPGPNPAHPGGLSRDDCITFKGFNEALCFAFRTDNSGPPVNITEILSNYNILYHEFPGATVKASTFEDFVAAVDPHKDDLEVVTDEIGDTWIQGIASDPAKMARLRASTAALRDCFGTSLCTNPDDPRIVDFVRYLIKPPEHTWGLPNVDDSIHWKNSDFEKARSGQNFKNVENAWDEQRKFLDFAYDALGTHELRFVLEEYLAELIAIKPDLTNYVKADSSEIYHCLDGTEIGFSPDGGLSHLYDPYNKVTWASRSGESTMGAIYYRTFNETDFDEFATKYNYRGGCGFDKPNVTKNAAPESRVWYSTLHNVYKRKDGFCDFHLNITMKDPHTVTYYGAPASMWVRYIVRDQGVDITFQWFSKTSTRLPEAFMLSFQPNIQSDHKWLLSKVGHLVDPTAIVQNGSQHLHAVDTGAYYLDSFGNGLQVLSQDVPLLSTTTGFSVPSPFPLPLSPVTNVTGVAYILYNNIWNTNYILYYPYTTNDHDFKSRYSLKFFKAQ